MPKYGIFTPYTLRFHSDTYGEDSGMLLKRSAVLFEELVYVAPRKQDINFIGEALQKEKNIDINEALKLFRPVSEFVEEGYMGELSLKVRPESNMCYGPNRAEFLEFIKKYLTKKFSFDAYNVGTKDEFEILDFYVTALSVDFDFLFQLSKYNEEFSALFTELHRDAYFATFSKTTSVPERVLNKVCSVNYFDFGRLSWAEIIELKRSNFTKDFRKKLFEWVNDFDMTKDEKAFEANIDKYIKESNFKFLKDSKPNLGKDIVLETLGFIPIPVNPISIYSSIEQITKDIRIKKEYGWLFFIQEAYDKINNKGR